MPALLAVVILGFVFGYFVRPSGRAYVATGIVSALATFTFVWSIADGKGNDQPSLLILMAIAVAIAFGLARLGSSLRTRKSV